MDHWQPTNVHWRSSRNPLVARAALLCAAILKNPQVEMPSKPIGEIENQTSKQLCELNRSIELGVIS